MTTNQIIPEVPEHENPPEQQEELQNSESRIDNQGNPTVVHVWHTPGNPEGPNQGQ